MYVVLSLEGFDLFETSIPISEYNKITPLCHGIYSTREKAIRAVIDDVVASQCDEDVDGTEESMVRKAFESNDCCYDALTSVKYWIREMPID